MENESSKMLQMARKMDRTGNQETTKRNKQIPKQFWTQLKLPRLMLCIGVETVFCLLTVGPLHVHCPTRGLCERHRIISQHNNNCGSGCEGSCGACLCVHALEVPTKRLDNDAQDRSWTQRLVLLFAKKSRQTRFAKGLGYSSGASLLRSSVLRLSKP